MHPAAALLSALRDQATDAQRGRANVLLTGPVAPDGDSIGACLALQRLLEREGVSADVAGTPSYRYRWMPGAEDMVPDDAVEPHYGAVVVLDGDRHRLPAPVEQAFHAAPLRGIVDHHLSTKSDGYTHAWLDHTAESACGMLLRACGPDLWNQPLDPPLATLLYTGLAFDTGGFRYSNSTPGTHRAAADLLACGIDHVSICARLFAERRPEALRAAGRVFASARWLDDGQVCVAHVPAALHAEHGLIEGDLEGVVDALVHTVGTDVAALLVERPDGSVKVSLRSRADVDVAAVAAALTPTGGGHRKAAGASLSGPPDEVERSVAAAVAAARVEGRR
jgi:phosphoesterase RecJ-like protein